MTPFLTSRVQQRALQRASPRTPQSSSPIVTAHHALSWRQSNPHRHSLKRRQAHREAFAAAAGVDGPVEPAQGTLGPIQYVEGELDEDEEEQAREFALSCANLLDETKCVLGRCN